MFYIYILESEKNGNYYVGYSHDPSMRLYQHNETSLDSFTKKHRPWCFKVSILIGISETEAIRVERYIKRQKQRRFIQLIIEKANDPDFVLWLKNKCSAG